MNKKILSVLLIALMVLSMITLGAFAADEESKTLSSTEETVDSVMRTEIPASLYDAENSDAEVVYNGSNKTLTVPAGKKVSFTFNVEKAGIYRVALKSRAVTAATTVSVSGKNSNGEALYQFVDSNSKISVASTCNIMKFSAYRESVMGRYEFTAGEHTMTFTTSKDVATDTVVLGLVIKYVETLDVVSDDVNLIKTGDYLYSNIPNNSNLETSSTGDNYILNTVEYGKIMNALTTNSSAKCAVYSLDVMESGLYKIKLYAKKDSYTTSCTLRVGASIDDMLAAETSEWLEFVTDGVEMNCKIAELSDGFLVLEKGQQFLELGIKNKSSNSYIYFFVLEKVADFQNLENIKVNGKDIESNNVIARGSDSFELDFVRAVDSETVNENTIYLMGNSKKIEADFEINGDKVYLNLKETLAYNTEYVLYVDGVKDTFGTMAQGISFEFSTGDATEDSAVSSVCIDSYSNKYLSVTIKGKVLNSKGGGISGRNIKVYLKDTEGKITAEPVYEGSSAENGEFAFDYAISDVYENVSGIYTFMIEAEYMETTENVGINYISPQDESVILKELEDAKNVSDVESFVNSYGQVFGITPQTDLAGLEKSGVYSHLIGITVSFAQDFRDCYFNAIALEKINQATTTDEINNALNDEELCNRLGLDKNKMDLIVNSRTDFLTEVLSLSAKNTAKDLADDIDKILNENLAKEYSKSDVVLASEDVKGYVGQSVEISLNFAPVQENIKKLVYNISCEDSNVIKDAIVDVEAGSISVEENEGKLIIVITRDDVKENIENIGTVKLTAPSKATSVVVKIDGTVEFDEKIGYPIYADITSKTVTITAVVNNKKGSTGGSSHSSSSAVSSVVTVDKNEEEKPEENKPLEDTETKEPEIDCNFVDMKGNEWAVESVNVLFEKGIISDNDEKIFRPSDNITREEFVKLIVEALDLMHGENETSLTDVKKGEWYYPYIAVAEANGIVTGDEYGRFKVGENITRQDMAVIIIRVIDKLRHPYDIDGEKFADDAEISEYAKNAMYGAKNLSIINGVGDNKCAPRGFATRAMAAKVIYEMMKAVGL